MEGICCPYHLARAHRKWLVRSDSYVGDDTPLFPTDGGSPPAKTAMVTTIEALALATGQQLVDAHDTRAFGGHTLRVTGAQLLAELGLEVMKIRIFARHGGDTILRYVAEAPLRTLRSDLGIQQSSTSAAGTAAGCRR